MLSFTYGNTAEVQLNCGNEQSMVCKTKFGAKENSAVRCHVPATTNVVWSIVSDAVSVLLGPCQSVSHSILVKSAKNFKIVR